MLGALLQKVLGFTQLYEEKKDDSLLTDCENVPEYKDILRALNKLTIKDLGLDDQDIKESFIPGCISAATIVESPVMSIGYFFIPAGMALTPHDHPGMLVTSKVLIGEVHRRALDLVDREKQFELPQNPVFDIEDQPYSGVRLDAIVESDEVFSEGEMLNLTPTRGNVHCFKALKDTLIFDVLTPYYDQEVRFCNFYLETENVKPNMKMKLNKKVKKEVTEEDKKQKGFKTTLLYLYEPPKIEFKILTCKEDILKPPA